MKNCPFSVVVVLMYFVLLLGTGAMLLGCGSDPSSIAPSPVSSSSSTTSATGSPSTTLGSALTTTTPPVTLSFWDKELADNAKIVNDLATHLSEQEVAQDDARLAVLFGLRARTQACSCRKAIAEGDLVFAQQAMAEIYSTINRGRVVAEGEVLGLLTDASAVIETLGDLSTDPQRAMSLVEEFVATLKPLQGYATKLVTGTLTTST